MAADKGFPLPLAGGCRCGRVRYRVTQPPKFIFACHCTDCQQLTASAFSLGMVVLEAGFKLQEGRGDLRWWTKTADSGQESRQYTCQACAGWTHTVAASSPGVVIVRAMTLDERGWVRPVAQIFTRSALPWALMPAQFSFATEFEDTAPMEQAFAVGGIRP